MGIAGVVRLTRRGRALLVLMVMAVLVVAGMMLGGGSSQAASHRAGPESTMTVQRGDTLWTVAARVAPEQDPRLVVAKLEAANRLRGPGLVAGQQLVIPAFG